MMREWDCFHMGWSRVLWDEDFLLWQALGLLLLVSYQDSRARGDLPSHMIMDHMHDASPIHLSPPSLSLTVTTNSTQHACLNLRHAVPKNH